MAVHGLRNTTAGTLVLRDISIPAGNTYVVFDTSTRSVGDVTSIDKSVIEDSAGLNFMLANGSLVYSVDAVDQTAQAFYDFFGQNAPKLRTFQATAQDDSKAVTSRAAIEFVLDADPDVIEVGHVEYVIVPYLGEVESWKILAEPEGTATIGVWKSETSALPTVAGAMVAGGISVSGRVATGTSAAWTSKTFKPGAVIGFSVTAASAITKIKVVLLTVRRSVVGADVAAVGASSVKGTLFNSVADLLAANLAGVSTAFIAGGGCVRLQGSEWYGDMGAVDIASQLPATTDIAPGSSIRVCNDGVVCSEYVVSEAPKRWIAKTSSFISVFQGHQNLFNEAAQVEPAANLTQFVDNSGALQGGLGIYYLSAPIAVTPGERIIFSAMGPEATSYGGWYNSSNVWIAPIDVNSTADGCLLVPAGAAFIRVNASTAWSHPKFVVKVGATTGADMRRIESVAAIGDSITNGGGYTSADEIWWKIAGRRLGASTFRNYGASGQNAYYHLNITLPSVVISDLIFFMPGTADHILGYALGASTDATNANTFYGALNGAAEFFHRRFAGCKVIWCTPPKNRIWDTVNGDGKTLRDYADAVANTAWSNCITLCDFFYNSGVNMSVYPNWRFYFQPDGVHPNILGNKVLSELPYRILH
jgi:lysophospholipase L1-like esterase